MNIEETKKITLSLIETFNRASHVALDLRKAGLKKKLNQTYSCKYEDIEL